MVYFMENPIKMDDLGGYHYFLETPKSTIGNLFHQQLISSTIGNLFHQQLGVQNNCSTDHYFSFEYIS